MKKIILYGAGFYGHLAFDEFGSERVEFFCDTSKSGSYCGVPIINISKLKEIHSDYDVIVTVLDSQAREEIGTLLDQCGIPFSFWGGGMDALVHISGKFPDIYAEFEYGTGFEAMARAAMRMYQRMLGMFPETFMGKSLDIWLSCGDSVLTAYDISAAMKLQHIHAWSTIWVLKECVIPIPDHSVYIDEHSDPVRAIEPKKCMEAARKPWSDSRAYWRGNLITAHERKWLHLLGKEHPDRLLIESSTDGSEFVSMLEQAKYKYLIDIRGYGWSDRLKTLLQLGRPVLMVDRPYREWYFDYLRPMVHYVPVKEDLSDLIERIDYLDAHPEVYDRIVANAKEFCKKHLVGRPVLEYLRDVTLQYDVVEKLEERNAPWNPEKYRRERFLLDGLDETGGD